MSCAARRSQPLAWISKDAERLKAFYAKVFDADVGPTRSHGDKPGETMTVVAARCGFVREGVLRSHIAFKGGRRDTVVFSMLPRELR
jgi:hypothetical protein